ncbi:hypothetical protein ACWGDT_40590 [Streptomyces avermitilis]
MPDEKSALFRAAVRHEIDEINKRTRDPQPSERHARKGCYGPYDDSKYALNLKWVSELVSRRMHDSLTPNDIYQVVRENARTLPRDQDVRRALLEAFEDVLTHCRRLAEAEQHFGGEPSSLALAETCMEEYREPSLNPLGFNHEDLGFFQISIWNPQRKMEPENVADIRVVSRAEELEWAPAAGWIRDQARYDRMVNEAYRNDPGSPCPSLVNYRPDHREQDLESHKLRLAVCETRYASHVALRNYMRADPGAYEAVERRILEKTYTEGRAETLADVIRAAPDSNIVINVTVQSRNGRVMLIRRPGGASVWSDFYQVGAHETMNWHGPQGELENWFELAERALEEEIGLHDPADYYEKIVFSWFGFYALEGSAYFFAHVRTRLNERQLVDAVEQASGRLEAAQIEWMTLDKSSIRRVLDTWKGSPYEKKARKDERGRFWLPHATMSLTQLERVSRLGMLETPTELRARRDREERD